MIIPGTTKVDLLDLHILPLMYIYEINDIMFFVKSYKRPLPHFDIRNFITFSTQSTRSASFLKLFHLRSRIYAHHFFILPALLDFGTLCQSLI